MKQLRLEVLFGGKNKLSPALKAILGSSNAASRALKKTRDEIRSLNEQQKKIDGYQKQKKAVQDQAKSLQDLQNHIKNLRQQMKTNPSADLTRDFDKSVAKARKLKQEYERNRIELQRMRTDMNNAGLSTNRLADHQQRLRTQLRQANQSMREQEQRLQRLTQMQRNYDRQSGHLRSAAGYGMGAAMAGAGAMYMMSKPINESKRYDVEANRIHALGLGDQVSKQAIKFAEGMETFGTSIYDNAVLVRDGMTIFSDLHHAEMVAPTLAKMKFSNQAMFGHEKGEENERAFMDMLKVIELRGGLKSEKAFQDQANKIQQVITATGGRVQGNEWLNAIKTGGIAVKGLTDEALYYKMESIVQEWGGFRYGTAAMSAYQNIYQGRTTKRAANNMERLGLIEDVSKLKHDKAGQVAFLDVGAIKGADLFKKDQFAWMEQVLLPQLASKGITEKGQILDAIGSIFTNRTASNLFGDMYLQRDIINKSAKMNAGADNIDQLYGKAKNTAAGEELETKAKLNDAYLRFGQVIMPIYTKALQVATGALESFTGWMERNPTLAKALGLGLLGIAASMIVIGGALVVFSPLILSMLSLRLLMASTATSGTILGRVFSKIPSIFGFVKSALFSLGRVFLWVGRLFLTNPILLAIAAIATAVYLIYRNWDSIGPWFAEKWNMVKTSASSAWESVKTGSSNAWSTLTTTFAPVGNWFAARWTEIKSAFNGGILGVSALIVNWSPLGLFYSAFASVLRWFGIDLPSKFTGFGTMIIDGLVSGIKSGFQKLKSTWTDINNYMPDFMKKKMDIHSPSRVMAGLGGHIMTGIAMGLDQNFPTLKEKFQHALTIFNPRASEAISKIDVAPALNKVRPVQAISPTRSAGQFVIEGDQITIQLTAAPGQNLQQLVAMIENVLDRRDRQKQARIRSSFKDQEY
ncbi:bacteriophage membrane protein [Acinetobacter gyllenbergii]|uniref:Phage tail tape measure protein, TP901 family, core region n=1 Tax=Acinetobacter gyllenbergii CIP 110306 = MTCC 11365 TaxID=1217657 RepID=A0A829HEM8_9GAMM|nr:hypothetical protein [Acinetobacter gyllenbergii]EPF77282.1 hypothetical protein F957_02760 [Acinetobacter gyllenbergii CIP 110306 = MTCC 11365]GMA11117.1 bacteriophage membrane protein [Acinetobacter gyllenbergii]